MQGRPTNAIRELRGRLAVSLFPAAAPSGGSTFRRWERVVLVLGLLILAVILQLLRIGPSTGLESLWAEDGQIFFQQALLQDFWHTVFTPYAGYLVLAPRLIGEVGNLVPIRDAAAAVGIAAGVVVALSGLAVWYASAGHIRNPYLRGTLVALTILAPVSGLECVASGAYVLWYMLFASFWLLLWRPATTRGAALGALFILVTGFSTPGLWFFAPLAGLRLLAARDRRDLLLVGSYAIGAAVQVPVIALNSEAAAEPLWTNDIWTAYAQRIVDGAALGERLGGIAWAALGWPFLALLLACLLAGLLVGLRRSTTTARWLAAIALPTSLLLFVVSAYQRAVGSEMVWPAGMHSGNAGRYAIVPALLLASVALALVDRTPRRRPGPGGLPWSGVAVMAVLLVGLVTSLYVRNTAVRGTPSWGRALDAAAAECASEGLAEARVPTSPPGFGVIVPCDRLSLPSDGASAR
jgi:hypothetical protein